MTRTEEVTIKELRDINKNLEAITAALKELSKAQKKPEAKKKSAMEK